jgi:ATP-dependent DNA helicase RecG
VDEQHRFGVSQRGQLRQKGYNPHVLVMTATPIPRSLALAMYGDLDLSAIHSIPAGRQTIDTHIVTPEASNKVWPFVRQHVESGRQAYVVCPLIEESDKLGVSAATEEYDHLSRHIFPDLRVGLLHGGLRTDDKERIMRSFRDGEIDVLVSTTVVEVGVDVPNATVMVILGADRFGLSQLHQLRGRVGRSEHKSYCLLLAETPSPEGKKRLEALKSMSDGFDLAQRDLELRGPGDFLGTQQSGLPELRVATLTDLSILENARAEAARLVTERDFETGERYVALRQRVDGLWQSGMEWS